VREESVNSPPGDARFLRSDRTLLQCGRVSISGGPAILLVTPRQEELLAADLLLRLVHGPLALEVIVVYEDQLP